MEYIYKFSNFSDIKFESLSKKGIWFSDLQSYNDPFEGEYNLKSEFKNIDNLIEAVRGVFLSYRQYENLDKFDREISQFAEKDWDKKSIDVFIKFLDDEIIEHIKSVQKLTISCFIQEKDGLEPLKNNLMWSHYADGLRGFCLKFDNEKLKSDFLHCGRYLASAGVNYSDNVPKICSLEYFSTYFPEELPGINLAAKIFMFNLLSSKSIDWSYEKEVRFFSNQVGYLGYTSDTLVELIIGEKMDDKNKNELIKLMADVYPKTKIKLAKKIPSTYLIEIVDLAL
ncbi:DUF2971 domain-containing protein [Vibrio fluvialis]|nr:DUF2971 domain-containing protein [Vibrio fluvialis]